MKSKDLLLPAFILLLAVAVDSYAQTSQSIAPDITILNFQVGPLKSVLDDKSTHSSARVDPDAQIFRQRENGTRALPDGSYVDPTQKKDVALTPSGPTDIAERPTGGIPLFLEVKNTGEKAIKALSWDYLFEDVSKDGKLRRESFKSKKDIAPGDIAILTKSGRSKGRNAKAEITRIEYADGSFWERPQGKE
jgi:hypothetical protein